MELVSTSRFVPSISADDLGKIQRLEAELKKLPQVGIPTDHSIHGGMYARTIMHPAGVMITGALIQRASILIVSGDIILFAGGERKELHGYNVLCCAPGRKTAALAMTDAWVTMVFRTDARTVEEAENELYADPETLASRKDGAVNEVLITEG